jgi:hypothetical protein
MKGISMKIKWQVNQEVLSSKIDEEAILMSIEADRYFSLEPVASRIWEILSEKAATIDELVTILMDEYEVDETTCREDVQQFLEEMSQRHLIQQLP